MQFTVSYYLLKLISKQVVQKYCHFRSCQPFACVVLWGTIFAELQWTSADYATYFRRTASCNHKICTVRAIEAKRNSIVCTVISSKRNTKIHLGYPSEEGHFDTGFALMDSGGQTDSRRRKHSFQNWGNIDTTSVFYPDGRVQTCRYWFLRSMLWPEFTRFVRFTTHLGILKKKKSAVLFTSRILNRFPSVVRAHWSRCIVGVSWKVKDCFCLSRTACRG